MDRQGFNVPSRLWMALLVLLILTLVVYLQLDNTPPQNISELGSEPQNVPQNLPMTEEQSASPVLATTEPQINVELPKPSSVERDTVAALGPEAARAAVHKVENSVYERATAMFEQEAVDVEWAAAYEQDLREMFSRHQGLQRVSVNSVSCHTSMCRIEVFTPRDADADFFTAMFYDALANFRDGALKSDAAIARRMEQGMTSVYVARKDHTLGFY